MKKNFFLKTNVHSVQLSPWAMVTDAFLRLQGLRRITITQLVRNTFTVICITSSLQSQAQRNIKDLFFEFYRIERTPSDKTNPERAESKSRGAKIKFPFRFQTHSSAPVRPHYYSPFCIGYQNLMSECVVGGGGAWCGGGGSSIVGRVLWYVQMCVISEFREQYTRSHMAHRYSSCRDACLSATCLFRLAFEHSTLPHARHGNTFFSPVSTNKNHRSYSTFSSWSDTFDA